MGHSAAIARIAPFAVFILFIAAQPLFEGAVDARWLVVGRGLAVALVLAVLWRRYGELRNEERPPPREWLLAIALGLAVFGAWIKLDSGWTSFSAGEGFKPLHRDGSLDWSLVALRWFGLALVVPVMEELFWRSFVMRWIDRRDFLGLDPRRTSRMAFALSSALFALEHAQWLAGLIAGLAYAWIYRRSADLRLPILSHATTNGTLGFWILATGEWRFW